ncbi:MAG: YdcF family protein [Bacteroidia bacterium]|nr:YdcF family protein [Bacteroidia bacterium]
MFYYLSKVLYGLVAPVSLVLIAFLLYFISGVKRWIYWAFGLTLFFSNPFIAQTVMGWYEVEPYFVKPNERYDALIILGGFISNYEDDEGRIRVVYNDGNDRMLQAISLYKAGVSKKIIYTAGKDTVFGKKGISEAESGKKFLLKCGIPETDIWIETGSLNTFENAYYTKKLLAQKDKDWASKKYLLITSGFHMRRSLGCFEKQGIPVQAYSTDIRSIQSKFTIMNTLMPTYGGFELWTYLFKEWIGQVVYWFKGYI